MNSPKVDSTSAVGEAPTVSGDGEPAFPRDHAHDGHNGMTLRDYFAAKAMPQLLELEATSVWNQGMGMEGKRDSALCVAKAAYVMADAMLKARKS